MSVYRTYVTKAGINTANSVMWQLREPAARRGHILEIGLFCEVAATTPPQFRLTRSLTLGTSSANSALQPSDPDSVAASIVLDTAWSAQPTYTTAGPFLSGWPQFNTVGQGLFLNYRDLWVPAGTGATSGLQIVNLVASGATTGTWGLHVVLDE